METETDLTREQAVAALMNGNRVAHSYFGDMEWMECVIEKGVTYFVFEDGVRTSPEQFWSIRTSEGWKTGWRIIE